MKSVSFFLTGLLLSATLWSQESGEDARLVGHWKMDESSGSVLYDSSGNGLDAGLHHLDGGMRIPGVFENGLNLNGIDQDAVVEEADLLKCESLTISAWVRVEPGTQEWRWVAGHGDNYGLVVNRFGEGGFFFYFYDGFSWPGLNAQDVDIRDGQWHHLTATFDASTGFISLFRDGALIESSYSGTAINYSIGDDFTIGSMMGQRLYKGSMDEVRVYSDALSLVEVIQVMNNGSLSPPPVLSNGSPSGYLPLGTRDTILSMLTDVPATCRYDTLPGIPFDQMSVMFSTTGGTDHSTPVTGLTDLSEYSYFCRCKNKEGDVNVLDYEITFRVEDILPLSSSFIPMVVIQTDGSAPVVDEPKVGAYMKVIDHGQGAVNSFSDHGNVYHGRIGIEIRGRHSASLPQKPYLLETRTESGENNNVSLLGMPVENDWILLANYNDKAFVRNSLAFDIFRNMGHYAPRARHCEVYLNGEYRGIYLLTEKIKRDKNRVDIAKLESDENQGDPLTGGYIIKTDYHSDGDSWKSSYPSFINPDMDVHFVYHYPDADEITPAQKEYIRYFMDSFEDVMHSADFMDPHTGYQAYMDVASFTDYFLVSELSRNVDAYKKSRYFFKDKDSKGGKLHSGPVWDYDWAWKNIYDCPVFSRTDGSGWSYGAGATCKLDVNPPVYLARLLEDQAFVSQLGKRYHEMRQTFLGETYLFSFIDSVAVYLHSSQRRHYDLWGTLGKNVGSPEVEPAAESFEEEIERLKDWIGIRLEWLDGNMPGLEAAGEAEEWSLTVLRVFPNPVRELLFVESDRMIRQLSLYTLSGRMVTTISNVDLYSANLDMTTFPPGIYILKAELQQGELLIHKVIIQ